MMIAGSSARVTTGVKVSEASVDRLAKGFRASGRVLADDVDVFQIRHAVADARELFQPALVGDDRLRLRVGQAKLQRVLAEQREQRHRDEAGAERGEMHHRQFDRLRQEHGDAVAALQAVRLQHIGEAIRQRSAGRRTSRSSRGRRRRRRSARACRCRPHACRPSRCRC